MAISSLGLLFFLLLSPSLSMASLPSEAQMREAGNRLSERFRQLRTNGLGVDYMKSQYSSATVNYSTIDVEDSSAIESLFFVSNPKATAQSMVQIIDRASDAMFDTVDNTTTIPPDCCSNSSDCCYKCVQQEGSNSVIEDLYKSLRNRANTDIEVQVGLTDGSLLEFPRIAPTTSSAVNCNSLDPRLTTWYTRATNVTVTPRYIVLFLNLNGASNVTILNEAALKVIGSLTEFDMISLVVVNANRQRLCPTSFVRATESQKWILSRIITDELLDSPTRDYQGAFNNIRDLFNSVTVDIEKLIIITDDGSYDFDGAEFNNVGGSGFSTIIYANKLSGIPNFLGLPFTERELAQLSQINNYLSFFSSSSQGSFSSRPNLVATDFNSKGELCLSVSQIINDSNSLVGVATVRSPWQQMFEGLEMSVANRPSSYYFVMKGDGHMMYHSRYPSTYVYDIDPMTIENNEAFPTILRAILNAQNESLPFNNTLIYSDNNQSYFTRTVPSTYYCWEVLDDLVFLAFAQSSPVSNVFACLVLADEDRSIVDTFRVSDIPGSYNQRSVPIYQDLLDDSSTDSCTDYCQYTSHNSLTLQLTTPLTPPTSSRPFQQYISGTSRNSPYDNSGIAEAVSVHSRIEGVWLRNSYPSIIRRYLTTPTGIFLSYRGLQLPDAFDPKGLPSYISAITNDNVLSLTPAFNDPLFPELDTLLYSISESVRLSMGEIEPLASVLSAEISMSSLMQDIDVAFGGGFCGVNNTECTVITSDGYFVLLPNGVTSPLHITEHSDYDGITLSMISNGVLVKTGCNNINDFSVNHDRFYYVNSSAISSSSCYITGTGCRDFCIRPIHNTTGYVIVSKQKSTCLTPAFSVCNAGQTECQFCDSFTNNLQCPCTCRTSACDNTTYNFQVCPIKLAPVIYTRASSNPVIPNNVMSCPQTCSNQTTSTCNPVSCSWCAEQNSCLSLGSCCVSTDSNCCNHSSITSLPSCLRDSCSPPSPSPSSSTTASPTAATSSLPIILGLTFGIIAALVIVALLVACFLWNVYCRASVLSDTKHKSDFNFNNEPVKATNHRTIETNGENENGDGGGGSFPLKDI